LCLIVVPLQPVKNPFAVKINNKKKKKEEEEEDEEERDGTRFLRLIQKRMVRSTLPPVYHRYHRFGTRVGGDEDAAYRE
jgi:hypothetical protein